MPTLVDKIKDRMIYFKNEGRFTEMHQLEPFLEMAQAEQDRIIRELKMAGDNAAGDVSLDVAIAIVEADGY